MAHPLFTRSTSRGNDTGTWHVVEIYQDQKQAKGIASAVKSRHKDIKTRVTTLNPPIEHSGHTFAYAVEWSGPNDGSLPMRTMVEARHV